MLIVGVVCMRFDAFTHRHRSQLELCFVYLLSLSYRPQRTLLNNTFPYPYNTLLLTAVTYTHIILTLHHQGRGRAAQAQS